MHFINILICFCVVGRSVTITIPQNNPVIENTSSNENTLLQELDEIARMIPFGSLRRLAARYLISDEQFQAFVGLTNSNDAHITQMHIRSQPETVAFNNWVRQQIMLSRRDFQLEESKEDLSIFNRSPFWPVTVYGWQSIANEFFLNYAENLIHEHVQVKISKNYIFAQFMKRLQALKPVYDSVTALPAALEANGIHIADIDTFIRNQFDWPQNRNIVSSSTAAVKEISTAIFADGISANAVVSVPSTVTGI